MMEAYTRNVDAAIAANDESGLIGVFSAASMGSLGQGEQRALCGYLVKKAVTVPGFIPAALSGSLMPVLVECLSNLPAVVENAADSTLRQAVFDHLVNERGDYAGAARVLGGMRMETDESSPYYMSPADTCDVYVKIAECFLEEDETVEADSAVTKAGTVVENITEPDQHMGLILRYKSTYARVLDSNRKFLQAASRYHDLSQSATDLIDADDLLQMLGRAATCAILAPSGAQKHRILGLLVQQDGDRLAQLGSMPAWQTHAALALKMHRFQVIRPAELIEFDKSLAEHQKALRGDGMTICQRAVMEHNMLAVSRLYKSIYLVELSKILGAPAEKVAATMIMDGSLEGEIDQVDGMLYFMKPAAEQDGQDEWNKGIMSFCTELNKVADNIKALTA